jgi:hypothetical protein
LPSFGLSAAVMRRPGGTRERSAEGQMKDEV